MRAVVQRVTSAAVAVNQQTIASIEQGLLVFLGVHKEDTDRDVTNLAAKIVNLRLFEDRQGKMNLSLLHTGGSMLIVSQFTLLGDCRRGRRPSWSIAAAPDIARQLYEQFISNVQHRGIPTACGQFQATMQVSLVNDGPVTMLIDSHKLF